MVYVVAAVILVLVGALVAAAIAGRVRLSSCCATSDPRRDLRMRAAYDED